LQIAIGVVIPARNESSHLPKTLSNLTQQTLKPKQIIVVNDNSTDSTKEIAQSYPNTIVVDFPTKHSNWQARKELALVFNYGLKELEKIEHDYTMILGADHLLPKDYLEKIINIMEQDRNTVICSGSIENEFAIVPRGSGRVVRTQFWRSIEFRYPVNFGFESYLIYKARSMGYQAKYLEELKTTTQRKTAITYDSRMFFNYGQACRALGYTPQYMLAVCAIEFTHHPKRALYHFLGYLSSKADFYENDVRNYVKKQQSKEFLKKRSLLHAVELIKKKGR